MNNVVTLAAILTVLTWTAPADAQKPILEVGRTFPDIAFPSMDDGSPMSIADFRGQKVILHVFASW